MRAGRVLFIITVFWAVRAVLECMPDTERDV